MAISQAGLEFDPIFDSMDVENLWLAGKYVHWRTGITMTTPPPPSEGYEKDTHCSSFAAAVALKLGVPLLSPPPEILLANRQGEWFQPLPSEWQAVDDPIAAQRHANEGYMVVISYLNPNPRDSGHIQIVRAHTGRSSEEIEKIGPQIIQAGRVNFNSTNAAEGFSSGYASSYPSYPWPHNVKYYAHATKFM
jgi:hypothetical protein